MFKVLILVAKNNAAEARMAYRIRDRLSWLRFLCFDLSAPTQDANTIRLDCVMIPRIMRRVGFREKLTETGTLQVLFDAFDHRLRTNCCLAMGGKIVDATLVAALKQPNTLAENAAITSKTNSKKSEVRALVEHVFAPEKQHTGLFIRSIGFKRAEAKVRLANLASNNRRLMF